MPRAGCRPTALQQAGEGKFWRGRPVPNAIGPSSAQEQGVVTAAHPPSHTRRATHRPALRSRSIPRRCRRRGCWVSFLSRSGCCLIKRWVEASGSANSKREGGKKREKKKEKRNLKSFVADCHNTSLGSRFFSTITSCCGVVGPLSSTHHRLSCPRRCPAADSDS